MLDKLPNKRVYNFRFLSVKNTLLFLFRYQSANVMSAQNSSCLVVSMEGCRVVPRVLRRCHDVWVHPTPPSSSLRVVVEVDRVGVVAWR